MYMIAVDLGGTQTKIGIVEVPSLSVVRTRVILTQVARGPISVLKEVRKVAYSLLSSLGLRSPLCLGIGIPGPLDRDRQRIYKAPNLPGWEGLKLRARLEGLFGVPVVLENDANLAAYGEWLKGAGIGTRSVVLYTLGTGIGGGIVIEGDLWVGSDGCAAELGHTCVSYGGQVCGCGQKGCLEAYASATALVKEFLRLSPRRGTSISAQKVCNLARRGNRYARQALSQLVQYMAISIVNVVHTLRPERVILSGGLSRSGELILGPIRYRVRRHLGAGWQGTRIVQGRLGQKAALIGAAGWALKRLGISAS
jgi:glucokinase